MGATSRTKGKAGEREVAAIVRDLTGHEVRRKVRQHAGDHDLEGVPGWCLEVKRYAQASRADVAGWWRQAVSQAQAARSWPVLFFRANRDEWRAVWPLAALLGMDAAEAWHEYAFTVESSVAGWACALRAAQGCRP
jgi:hypothetical protein